MVWSDRASLRGGGVVGRTLAAAAALLWFCVSRSSVASAFATVRPPRVPTSTSTSLSARVPEISDWSLLRNGAVTGTVRFHPEIDDDDIITTSPLADPDASTENAVVVTKSGSKYKLAEASALTKKILAKKERQQQQRRRRTTERSEPPSKPKQRQSPFQRSKPPSPPSPSPSPSPVVVAKKETPRKNPPPKVKLSGKTLGDGKYLLGASGQRSTSGKSRLWDVWRSDGDGAPLASDRVLKAKISTNLEAMRRENDNYRRATGGLFGGRFVDVLDYYEPRTDDDDEGVGNRGGYSSAATAGGEAALVMECGSSDLKALLKARGGRGLTGRAMRNAASAAGRCVQALHSSGLVWTDLKPENFVLADGDDDVDGDLAGVKGIDLESAVPIGAGPVDYSPEACPPEFARAFLLGEGAEFVVRTSYDAWSLGMMLYELDRGTFYFGERPPTSVVKELASDSFAPNVDDVENDRLRDLIRRCLDLDPTKRPSVTEFLLHPYFLTTGIGPLSF